MVKGTKKAGPGSDLNAKNSMDSSKVIGEFDEKFRETPILDRGHRASNFMMMEPTEESPHLQQKPDKKKNY